MNETVWRGRWFCPNCERILTKVHQRDDEGNAWHSWKCRVPMVQVDVVLTEAS